MTTPPPTRPSNTASLPLVLRREWFGGLLFDPADGTFLDLDEDGFALVHGWLAGQREPKSAEEAGFLAGVKAEVRSLSDGPRPFRAWLESPEPLEPGASDSREFEALAGPREARDDRRSSSVGVLSAPTLVDIQITRRCNMGCPQCYASADPNGEDVPFEQVSRVLEQASALGVCQIALGGGEPLLHPQIAEILARTHALGMVPNLTTNGQQMPRSALEAMARYCGAVALSLEDVGPGFAKRRRIGFERFEEAFYALQAHRIPTVLQVTLSSDNLERLPAIVDYALSLPDLYGVIFLAYKPVGRGRGFDQPLWSVPPEKLYPKLRDAFVRLGWHTRVGYDCCLTPGITGIDVELGFGAHDVLEGCSAARSSIGVTPELEVVPCTFATHRPLGDLRRQTLAEIWRGEPIRSFRRRHATQVDGDAACRECPARASCLGGCPEWDLVRCTRSGLRESQARRL